ncbi:MAG TPA: cytidylate kinase family protein [Candidatus Binatia bacterium]|nr:cytidylate kinase family protein [Candidatus Binatia bacterium]
MPIITIYQGASGEGQGLAEAVAQALGYRCMGREVLVATSRRYGIREAKLNEILNKAPHWWERLLRDLRPYKTALQATLCELAQDGKLVYHGHLGHELLPDIRHVLKVLLTAPIEYRIDQIRARQNSSEREARRYIEAVDKARSRRLMAMFGADWRDATRYDLALNMSRMSLDGARRMIMHAAQLEEYQPTPESQQTFYDFTLASRVHATLFASLDIQGLAVDIRASRGHVHLRGRVEEGMEEEVTRITETVSGVIHVTADLYSAPPEGVIRM